MDLDYYQTGRSQMRQPHVQSAKAQYNQKLNEYENKLGESRFANNSSGIGSLIGSIGAP